MSFIITPTYDAALIIAAHAFVTTMFRARDVMSPLDSSRCRQPLRHGARIFVASHAYDYEIRDSADTRALLTRAC